MLPGTIQSRHVLYRVHASYEVTARIISNRYALCRIVTDHVALLLSTTHRPAICCSIAYHVALKCTVPRFCTLYRGTMSYCPFSALYPMVSPSMELMPYSSDGLESRFNCHFLFAHFNTAPLILFALFSITLSYLSALCRTTAY